MQIIKYIMLFLVFISSTLIGKYISNKYILRLRELEEIKNALNMLRTKIKFTYEPIPEIFEEISKNIGQNVSKLFIQARNKMENKTASNSWEESIEEFDGNINSEDKQILKTLSKLLRNYRC